MANTPRRVSKAVLASSLSVLFAGSAQAAIYAGNFDPSSNGVTPAFNGFADFTIDPGCITPGFHLTNAGTSVGGCGAATVTSATVYLYGHTAGDLPGTPATALDTLGLATPPEPILAVLFGADGSLQGVDTDPMGLTTSTAYPGDNQYFLQFYTGLCDSFTCFNPSLNPPIGFQELAAGPEHVGDPGVLYAGAGGGPTFNNASLPATVTFCTGAGPCATTIPEPGALPLTFAGLLALVGGMFWKRRRNANLPA